MTSEEKEILKQVVEHPDGLLSPASLINGIAQGNRRSVEHLVSSGYIEEVPQDVNHFHGNTYTLNFYRATEKGRIQFAPIYKMVIFSFKNQPALYLSILTFLATICFSYIQTNRDNLSFELQMRPYLVVSSVEKITQTKEGTFVFHVKNVGNLPAKLDKSYIICEKTESIDDQILGGGLIGNGEELLLTFSNLTYVATMPCIITINYVGQLSEGGTPYETTYNFDVTTDGEYKPNSASFN